MQPRLALVGEIEIASTVEGEVVDTLEAFAVSPLEIGPHGAAADVADHQATAVVRDEQFLVAQELHAVRLALPLGHELPMAARIDAEDAAKGNVGDVKIACGVEDRPFEE